MTERLSCGALLALLILGFALRLYQLDAMPLRGDEAFSVQRWAATPLDESLTEIAAIEPHPVLTYVIFRIWGVIFGTDQVFVLRLLPVLANTIGIAALYALGTRLSGSRRIGLVAAGLWVIHPFQIWHAQDFRNYGIWAGLSAVTLWLGLRVVQRRASRDWIAYTLVALTTALIFYNELLTVGVVSLYALLVAYRERGFLLKWLGLNTGIIVVTVVSFIVLQGDLISSGTYSGTTGRLDITQYWTRFLPVLSFGDTLSPALISFPPAPEGWIYWAFLLLALVAAWIIVWRKHREAAIFLGVLAVAPLIVLGLISLRLYIFRPRYVLIAAPAYTLIISYAALTIGQRRWSRVFGIALLLGWSALSVFSLNQYYHNPAFAKAPDWPALVTYLEGQTRSSDVIIQTGVDAGFGYYYDRANLEADEFALPADVTQPDEDIITTLEGASTRFDSLWIVGRTFPDWPNAGVVENWAATHMQLTRETEIARLPVRQYKRWQVDPSELPPQPLATYDDTARLISGVIHAPDPTDTLTVWLYWQALAQTEEPLTIFVHLVGDTNPATNTPLWTQDDHPPQNGLVSTTTWEIDRVYRDVAVLPVPDLPSGHYRVEAGLYNPLTGERLPASPTVDRIYIGSVTIP